MAFHSGALTGTHCGTTAIRARDADEALSAVAELLSLENHIARNRVVRRGRIAYELEGVTSIVVQNPLERLCLNPARRLNPWVALAEFPWLMAGRCDVGWLLPYLPRAADFADDGRYWRAGYGPRLRRWGVQHSAPQEVDQVAGVIDLLHRDQFTRQAVVSLWDPYVDLGVVSKDIPCSNWLHFQCREDAVFGRVLDLTVMMRSNDVLWGFSGVNIINFTLLQEFVARQVGLGVGIYRHVTTNMHVYEEYLPRMEPIARGRGLHGALRGCGFTNASGRGIMQTLPLNGFTEACRVVLAALEDARTVIDPAPRKTLEWLGVAGDSWLAGWAYFMELHKWAGLPADQQPDATWWRKHLLHVANDAWRVAAVSWLARRDPGRFMITLYDMLAPIVAPRECHDFILAVDAEAQEEEIVKA